MAANDIRPFRSARGGTFETVSYPLTASASFSEGEPVVVTSGAVLEASDDPASVAGVAAHRSTDADGSVFATGTAISVTRVTPEQLWVANNFATDGAGTSATPTQANAVGQAAGLTLDGSGNWWVDTGTANLVLTIEQVLDAQGRDITDPTVLAGSGDAVVFRFL